MDPRPSHPGVFDPEVVGQFQRFLGPVVRRMWPASMTGLETLPDHGRYMVVANHSGMGIAELWALLLFWSERFGCSRPIAGMAHPGAFHVRPVRYFLDGLGAVEATAAGAARARAAGVPLLLFPGGDHEATRPFWQANRVDFAGRKGWIRLAREHGLTIVPLCITGSHNTLPILAGGRAVSWMIGTRLIGVHRAPLTVLSAATATAVVAAAVASGLPWWLGAAGAWTSVWATMALPWVPGPIGFHLLPAIEPGELADPAGDAQIYDRVVSALQRAMNKEIPEQSLRLA